MTFCASIRIWVCHPVAFHEGQSKLSLNLIRSLKIYHNDIGKSVYVTTHVTRQFLSLWYSKMLCIQVRTFTIYSVYIYLAMNAVLYCHVIWWMAVGWSSRILASLMNIRLQPPTMPASKWTLCQPRGYLCVLNWLHNKRNSLYSLEYAFPDLKYFIGKPAPMSLHYRSPAV